MAVRRQLRGLFQHPQPTGDIVIERPAGRRATDWKPVSAPPRPPPPPAVPVSPPRRQRLLPEECAVFHCRGCWTVLGDSLQLCGEEPPGLSVLICLKVTKDVICEDSPLVGLEGALLGSAYYLLSCRLCGLAVGFTLNSCSCDLACLRGLFCFFKDSIICYLLKNQITIEASKVDFPPVTLKEEVQNIKIAVVDFNDRVELLKEKVEKMERNNYATA